MLSIYYAINLFPFKAICTTCGVFKNDDVSKPMTIFGTDLAMTVQSFYLKQFIGLIITEVPTAYTGENDLDRSWV